jgi:hypothetical protein
MPNTLVASPGSVPEFGYFWEQDFNDSGWHRATLSDIDRACLDHLLTMQPEAQEIILDLGKLGGNDRYVSYRRRVTL